jgi:outer membrane protein assembly factor BamB
MEQPKVCALHPGEKVVGVCSCCGRPVCSVCRGLYGYFCSEECKKRVKARATSAEAAKDRAEIAAFASDFAAKAQRALWVVTRVVLPAIVVILVAVCVYRGAKGQEGKEVWRFKSAQDQAFSPLAADPKRLYVGCGDGIVRAVDKSTGGLAWSFQADSGATESAPVLVGDLCLARSWKTLYALRAADGKLAWKRDLLKETEGHPVLGAGVLCLVEGLYRDPTAEELRASSSGEAFGGPALSKVRSGFVVRALSLKDGAELWKTERKGGAGRAGANLVIGGATVYASSTEVVKQEVRTLLLAYDAGTGAEKWNATVSGGDEGPGTFQATPKGVLVVTGKETYLILADGKEAWRVARAEHVWRPVVDGERVYCGEQATLAGLDLNSGTEIWRTALPLECGSRPSEVLLPGLLLVRTVKKDSGAVLCAVDTATGKVKWTLEQPGERLLLAGGLLLSLECCGVPSLPGTETVATRVAAVDPAQGAKLWQRSLNLYLQDCLADEKRLYLSSSSHERRISVSGIATVPGDNALSAIGIGR